MLQLAGNNRENGGTGKTGVKFVSIPWRQIFVLQHVSLLVLVSVDLRTTIPCVSACIIKVD